MRPMVTLALLLACASAGNAAEISLSPAQKYFTDVILLDQDGRPLRLYTDLLQGKIVVIDSFYTTCTGPCPIMGAAFARIQNSLGERLGKDVFLLSITVDPQYDTPGRLKEYAQRIGARPGWIFLTGSKEKVDFALYKLGLYTETREQHKIIFIAGNEPKGLWKKLFGLANPDELAAIVGRLMSEP